MGASYVDHVTPANTLKRPEIDRRVAGGEPVAQVARDYDLNLSSLHRHKTNCLKLALPTRS